VIAVLGLDYDIRGEANLLLRYQRFTALMIAIGALLSVGLGFLIAKILS
jgi:hypothetical protein